MSVTEGDLDVLALLAYVELRSFHLLAGLSELAPEYEASLPVVRLAARKAVHHDRCAAVMSELGEELVPRMRGVSRGVDEFHDRSRTHEWLEGLVKLFIGDGILRDFFTELTAYLDDEVRPVVVEVASDRDAEEFVVDLVRSGIRHDYRAAGRLSLWGRRLGGEAVVQVQRLIASRDGLTAMLVAGAGEDRGLVAVSQMTARLSRAHAARMERLSLSA